MKKLRVYVYPDRSYSLKPDTNPYIRDLGTALEANGAVVIRSKTAWLGVIDIFLQLRRTDAVIFNWVEEAANRTLGWIQVPALAILLPTLNLLGIKIIWTVHNKVSHNPRNRWLSAYFRMVLTKRADVIVTHAKESTQATQKPSLYYPHPFRANAPQPPSGDDFVYDVLFWGTLLPYKGIKEFLAYVHEKKLTNLRIHIQGKCPDAEYGQALKKLETNSIRVVDRFTPDDELRDLFRQSQMVVFTYRSESVLSSGALMESLANYKTVIGPDFGNFRDCRQEGLAYTYTDFDELVRLISDIRANRLRPISTEKIDRFIQHHSWDSYAQFLMAHVGQSPPVARAAIA